MKSRPVIGISANISPPDDPKREFNKTTEIYYIQQPYMTLIEAAGGTPVLLTPYKDDSVIPELLSRLDGIMMVGGIDVDPSLFGEDNTHSLECNLTRDLFDIALVKNIRKTVKPCLGICRGMQIMNVAYGGDLFQDIPVSFENPLQHGFVDNKESFHMTNVKGDTLLHRIIGETDVRVNSSHHQSVRNQGVGLEIISRSEDGVVEAIYDTSNPRILGVQWHPERMQDDDKQLSIARWLVDQAQG